MAYPADPVDIRGKRSKDDSASPALDSPIAVSPLSGGVLTREHAVQGGKIRAAQRRAERELRQRTVAQALAERIEAEADRILAAYFTAIDSGDWRAGEALLDRHLGKAVQRQEIEDVTERSADVQADLAELERLDRELKARKAA